MSIQSINLLSDRLAQSILDAMLSKCDLEISYDTDGVLIGNFDHTFNHVGLYGFILTKDNKSGISYIGKTENNNRLRQHITGKNKDGTPLKQSVSTKYNNIKNAIADGYKVWLSLYSSDDFNKSSLSCMEISCIRKGINQFESVFPNEKTWNKRI